MVRSGRADVVTSKGCSKLFPDITCALSSFRELQPTHPSMSPATSSVSLLRSTSNPPFSGLVICVTGLSKEARKQVMDATERLGGQYSPHLHPRCTHLVVQSSHGRKFEYALKHGAADGLFIVTLGWFVHSVRRNMRLNESLYKVKSFGENYMPKDDVNNISSGNSCLHIATLENAKESNLIKNSRLHSSEDPKRRTGSSFSGQSFYVDADVSVELRNKVVEATFREGALLENKWLVGHGATHVVCEGSSVRKYLGHSDTLVTPLWVLKTAKETRRQRLVHLSAGLACHVGMMLGDVTGGIDQTDSDGVAGSQDEQGFGIKSSHEKHQSIAILAKKGTCRTLIKSLTRTILLDSICWSISEPSSTACIYTDSFGFGHHMTFASADANETIKEPDVVNFSRPLSKREKNELVFGYHFITILFPVDRFAEMGLCSRMFFSDPYFVQQAGCVDQ